jgi:NAD(P) transhydrogenase
MESTRETGATLLRAEIAGAPGLGVARVAVPRVSADDAWRIFADTDLLNRAIGNPAVDVCNIPVRPGVARRVLTTREAPPTAYEEEHYQWEEGRWLGGRRFFGGGPLEKMVFVFTPEPTLDGAVVECRFGFWSREVEGRPLAASVAQALAARIQALEVQLRDAHRMARPRVVPPSRPEQRVDPVQLRVLAAALVDSGEDPACVADLARHVEGGGDLELTHMAPLALAREWRRDAGVVTDVFVRAARLGMLLPRWSVACPGCRGMKGTTDDVVALAARPLHCADCNISFDADPTSNMALTFTPAPSVRRIDESFACIAAPTRTPHVKAQAYVPPGGTLRLARADLARPGLWLSCPETSGSLRLGAAGRYRLEEEGVVACAADGEGGDALEISNGASTRVRIRLEDRELPDTFLRASRVLERPRFRELFGADQWEFLSAMERAWRSAFGHPSVEVAPNDADRRYDLVVVGSGPGGEAAAVRAAQLGARVALVEASATFGGPSGLPSKAMRESVRKIMGWADSVAGADRDAARRLVRLRALFEQRFASLRRYVASLQMQEVAQRLTRAGVCLHHGTASLDADGAVEVRRPGGASYHLAARHVVLATGSRPARPPGIPFGPRVLDAVGMGQLERLPRTLCVVGAGVIGCEFATIMAALGVKVTIVAGTRQPYPFLDRELMLAGLEEMRSVGIGIVSGAPLARATVDGGARGQVIAELEGGAAVASDLLLYAEGRDGNSDGIGCERAGVAVGRYGQITVDAEHRTSNPRVFAVGDVTGPPGLASAALQQGKEVAESLYGKRARRGRETLTATTLWTFPEMAGIGLTEDAARAQSADPVVGRAWFRDLPRGILSGALHGWLKLVAARDGGRLLGVHIIGESACEMIHYGRALIEGGATLEDLAQSGFSAMTFHGLYQMAAEDALAPPGERRTPQEPEAAAPGP